ncbi:unnamed protein product, partial [Mesorhabditis spiculigera]
MNLASTSTTPYYEDSTSDTTPLPDDDYSAEVDPSEQLFDIVCMATIFLTFNRFFALAFSGSYYKYYERTNYVQYGIMVAYPLATGIAYAIPGCGAIFIPYGQNFFYVEGACGEEIMYYTQILASYIVLSIQTVFDAAIFYLMRKRIRSFQAIQSHQNSKQKREQLKKEMRLAAQMISNLITGIILNVTMAIGQQYLASTLATFLLFTALWQGCQAITSRLLHREGKTIDQSRPHQHINIFQVKKKKRLKRFRSHRIRRFNTTVAILGVIILFCECKVHPGSSGYCMVIVYMVACFMLPAIAIGAFVGYMGYKRGKAGKKMIGG